MSPDSVSSSARRSGERSQDHPGSVIGKRSTPTSDSSFLGRGWSFPPGFERAAGGAVGGVEMVGGDEDIRQSIGIILSTEPGERAMQPAFGCPLRRFVFQRIDVTMQTRIKDAVFRALLHWEPRIRVEEIGVEEGARADGIVRIGVDYTIRATNSRFNLVFPYHIAEGSRLLE